MLDKPKKATSISVQDRNMQMTAEELRQRYDLENKGLTKFIETLIDKINKVMDISENDLKINNIKVDPSIESKHTPTFLNSWVNYDNIFQQASYYKKDGRVYLTGLVKSGTIGQPIFILPEGYRPVATELCVTISSASLGRVDILNNGEVICKLGSNVWVSLSGISFRVD